MKKSEFPEWTPSWLIKHYEQISSESLNLKYVDAVYILGSCEDRGVSMKWVWESLFKENKLNYHSDEVVALVCTAVERAMQAADYVAELETPAIQTKNLRALAKKIDEIISAIQVDPIAKDLSDKAIERAVLEKRFKENPLDEDSKKFFEDGYAISELNKDLRLLQPDVGDMGKRPWEARSPTKRFAWWAKNAAHLNLIDALERMSKDLIFFSEESPRRPKGLRGNLIPQLQSLFKFLYEESKYSEMAEIVSAITGVKVEPKNLYPYFNEPPATIL